jgi:UDPglucose 6-dehydrogenase
VVEVNRAQHERIVEKIRGAAGGSLAGAVIGVWGLTFKADTDDLRDSPSLVICGRLLEAGATVRAYDPAAAEKAQGVLPGVELCADPYQAAQNADAVALLTEWDEFRWLDFDRVAATMKQPAIIDSRNLLDPAALRRRGFRYDAVGRR